ncbi:phenylalanine--tRNA ligase subunit alpha [bacterium]|nr:phenylalanine--tRNA ligase subunit alpha [Parcubacteria group bacterium]MBF05576.1 phenylalanine--tRNA ligase subunit alpha [bacterium]|tara:strand:- start:13206 stop:13937 length:732 start_codon:yes stop_codon:yes gene_type:complete
MTAKEKEYYIHPLTSAVREIVSIFSDIGFEVASGPELETEYYNFDALNVAKDHPARDMQDTFWVDETRVLRTHDTSVTARKLEENNGEMRFVSCGKAYRNEATDMTHEAQFYQVDAFAVGKDVTLAHLKGTLETFFSTFLGGSVEVRFRPGFFPFVEPGVEVDMRLTGDAVPVRLKGKWIEILGAGMLHPNVLRAGGINPEEYQGWAFGGGIERLCMLKWGIDDVRLFHSGDLRFIQQFTSHK